MKLRFIPLRRGDEYREQQRLDRIGQIGVAK